MSRTSLGAAGELSFTGKGQLTGSAEARPGHSLSSCTKITLPGIAGDDMTDRHGTAAGCELLREGS